MNQSRTRRRNRRIFTRLLGSFLLGLSACSLADCLTEMARAEMTCDYGAVFCVLCPATLAALLMAVTLFADGFAMVRRRRIAWGAEPPTTRNVLARTWDERRQGDPVTACGSD